jgi:hypothetical protein
MEHENITSLFSVSPLADGRLAAVNSRFHQLSVKMCHRRASVPGPKTTIRPCSKEFVREKLKIREQKVFIYFFSFFLSDKKLFAIANQPLTNKHCENRELSGRGKPWSPLKMSNRSLGRNFTSYTCRLLGSKTPEV